MSTEPFIGEIKIFGFSFQVNGYALCQGQLMSIQEYTPLYALIGTIYGGDGINTFALPDLQGRRPVGQGQGPGLSNYTIGQKSGSEQTTLAVQNMPSHVHTLINAGFNVSVNTANGDTGSPSGAFLAASASNIYAEGPEAGKTLGGTSIIGTTDLNGGNEPFNIMNPFLTLNYSIATEGIFPSRP
jgi:microcystin-dependent protein